MRTSSTATLTVSDLARCAKMSERHFKYLLRAAGICYPTRLGGVLPYAKVHSKFFTGCSCKMTSVVTKSGNTYNNVLTAFFSLAGADWIFDRLEKYGQRIAQQAANARREILALQEGGAEHE